MIEPELAPEECIVCGKKKKLPPGTVNTWVYLAGATPLGSMACGPECATVAVERFVATGRCDDKGRVK